MFLVETHDDVKHAVASATNANGMEQDSIGSKEDVERLLKVGQDYSNGECLWNCVEVCDWKKTKGCKWVFILLILPNLKTLYLTFIANI